MALENLGETGGPRQPPAAQDPGDCRTAGLGPRSCCPLYATGRPTLFVDLSSIGKTTDKSIGG